MYLLRKILRLFDGNNLPLPKDYRLQIIITRAVNTRATVHNQSKGIIAVLILGIGFFGMSCTNTSPDKSLAEVEEVQPQATNYQPEPALNTIPAKYVVTIKDMKYNPAVTQANIGDTILFVNKDLVPHNVADSLTKKWLSPQLDFGAEWSLIVRKNLHFYCAFHPNMEGDIQLKAPLNAQKSR